MISTYVPQILIFLGLLLTFLGGLITYTRDHELQKENRTFAIENKKLVQDNLKLSELISNNLTGGNSYGAIHPLSILDNGHNIYVLYFENKGDFPLYDVSIRYWNPDVIKKEKIPEGKATTEILKHYTTLNIGNISSHGGLSFGTPFKISEGEILKLNFSITAKNGSFSQLLRIAKINGNLSVARRVNTISTKAGEPFKILLEEADNNFPQNKNGNIEWE